MSYRIGANISAVAAGSLPYPSLRARSFAKTFSVPNAYGSYAELAQDPDVDIVYIGATNQLHYNIAMVMMAAGKHVLVEKPTAMNEVETKEMFDFAEQQVRHTSPRIRLYILILRHNYVKFGFTVMRATVFLISFQGVMLTTNYWSKLRLKYTPVTSVNSIMSQRPHLARYFPAFRYARKHLESLSIGRIIAVQGDFAFRVRSQEAVPLNTRPLTHSSLAHHHLLVFLLKPSTLFYSRAYRSRRLSCSVTSLHIAAALRHNIVVRHLPIQWSGI